MRNASNRSGEKRDYVSYLLRLWRDSARKGVWRASLEGPHTGECIGFASLEALFAFLRQQTHHDLEEKR